MKEDLGTTKHTGGGSVASASAEDYARAATELLEWRKARVPYHLDEIMPDLISDGGVPRGTVAQLVADLQFLREVYTLMGLDRMRVEGAEHGRILYMVDKDGRTEAVPISVNSKFSVGTREMFEKVRTICGGG